MKVGFYQFDVKLGKIDYNLGKVEETLIQSDFDLIVLPELFTTGYLFSSKEEIFSLSEAVPNGKTVQLLVNIAKRKQAFIIGGIAEVDNNKVFNTAVVVGPNGYIGKHRKIHLTTFEKILFDRGNNIEVFDINGVMVGVEICYDAWFPELTRILINKGAQIICHPSNFGGTESLDIIKVRALENMVYTITCNRIGIEYGRDFDATFRGESQIIGCDGELLQKVDSSECVFIMDIDPNIAKDKNSAMSENLFKEINIYEVKKSI